MKKSIFELFIEKIQAMPLWVKQALYLKLSDEMQEYCCEDFLKDHTDDIFATFKPTLTFRGKTELTERKGGFDNNIYNFLRCCSENQSILEISVNTFLSMEEVAKYYEFCLEQSFVKTPESKEIHAMAGFIAGKFRVGEYFKQKGQIDVDQLQQAIIAHKEANKDGNFKYFSEILTELGFVSHDDLKSLLALKEEAKKRFILDYNTIPKPEIVFKDNNEKQEQEIRNLKEENIKLKRKMIQLLEMVKKNVQ